MAEQRGPLRAQHLDKTRVRSSARGQDDAQRNTMLTVQYIALACVLVPLAIFIADCAIKVARANFCRKI
jgi:hypothetical protein